MKRRIKLFIFALCTILLFTACSQQNSQGANVPVVTGNQKNSYDFSVTFIDVGQGDSALISCDGQYMLIDGGPASAGDTVYDFLRDNGIDRLKILAISHIHDDHIGGLERALSYASTEDIVLCNTDKYSPSGSDESDNDKKVFAKVEQQLSVNGAKIVVPSKGAKYKLGSADVEVVDVGDDLSKNESLVLLITYGQTTFLFTGDIEHNMEEQICEEKNDNFPVTLLKVSHHGSDTSTSIRFLRMLNPQYAVISVGRNNRYNHPSEQTLSRLDQADVKAYRTDRDGNITVRSNGTDLDIQTSK